MTRIGTLLHLGSAVTFVVSGVTLALWGRSVAAVEAVQMSGPLLAVPVPGPIAVSERYLVPDNPLMWALLVTVWAMVLLDAVGQVIDPSDAPPVRAEQARIWTLAVPALIVTTLCLRLTDRPSAMSVLATIAAVLAVIGARRSIGRHRPALGFLAGWTTALASAALAQTGSSLLGLPLHLDSAMAILPAAVMGIVAQVWIGPGIAYSVALIWAFCALAIATMGTDPLMALAAILGIAAMATVLVRAAS